MEKKKTENKYAICKGQTQFTVKCDCVKLKVCGMCLKIFPVICDKPNALVHVCVCEAGGFVPIIYRGARWLSGRVSDSGARGPGFETYLRRVVSLSKTLYSPKVLVNYPGSDGSVPT